MRAVLANQKIPAFSENYPVWEGKYLSYKTVSGWGQTSVAGANCYLVTGTTSRFPINADETLKQWTQKFDSGKIFKSASEICDMFLVPQGSDLTDTKNGTSGFWSTHRVTGDNARERPYNAIYPRVTTRSNTYTVYVKAQAIKQVPSTLASAPDTFTADKDVVEGEFQASYTFERYLDPNAPPATTDMTPLGPYKMRVINQRNLSW